MHRCLTSGLAGLTLALGLAAPAAATTVSVRVEGATKTLVEQVDVEPAASVVVDKTATGGTTCAGTSGGGALELATGGDWSGPAFSFGQSIETIKGESHSFDSPAYWALYVNDKASEVGICDFTPAQGDEVLLFPACVQDPAPGCATGGPLDLRGPAVAEPGKRFKVRADQYAFDGTKEAAAGATVTVPGGGTVTTGEDGSARVKLTGTGRKTLTVTKEGSVRDELVVCLTEACRTAADDTPPRVRIKGIDDDQRFARRRGPRKLTTVVRDADSGIASIELGLVRRAGGTCTAYSAKRERFVEKGCKAHPRFDAGTGPKVSYLLPSRLGKGRYTLEVVARDKAGNRATDRLEFSVR